MTALCWSCRAPILRPAHIPPDIPVTCCTNTDCVALERGYVRMLHAKVAARRRRRVETVSDWRLTG